MREGKSSVAGSRRSRRHGNVRFRWPETAERGSDAMEFIKVKISGNDKLNRTVDLFDFEGGKQLSSREVRISRDNYGLKLRCFLHLFQINFSRLAHPLPVNPRLFLSCFFI